MKKTRVFLTGATGNMGWAGFMELYAKRDRFDISVLVRPSAKNRKKLAPYMDDPAIRIVWGDLTVYEDVLKAAEGADYVLHVGGMVSPAADYYPEKTLKVNVAGAENVVKAVLAQPNADEIKVVYIGSVAEYGNRMRPVHWGRTGDPMRASEFDMYSVSKCKAEKLFVDSGLKKWVVLRQTGILYGGILGVVNPTAFHVPVQGMLEWATIEDSGRVLGNIVEPSVPEEFWNRIYNISSGEQYRMTNYEFESRILAALGLPGPEKIFEAGWFATRNFHGMWYTDADELEKYLHFRENMPVDAYFKRMKSTLPWYYSLAFLAPAWAVKMFMKSFAFEKGLGTQTWLENDKERLRAFFGSREEFLANNDWNKVRPPYIEKNLAKADAEGAVVRLDHGYDESKSIYALTVEEVEAAARFRGGKFLGIQQEESDTPQKTLSGEKGTVYLWECEHGHRFSASLEWVLLAGGWCSSCDLDKFHLHVTQANAFASQVI